MTLHIFDRSIYKRNFKRIEKEIDFLYRFAAEIALENLENQDDVLIYGHFPQVINAEYKSINDYDEEDIPKTLPKYSSIVSNLSLHYVNDILKALIDYKSHLHSGGKFIATFLGGNTLVELRKILMEVDTKIYGGVAQRIIPMIDVKDAGRLMQKAGFVDSVAISETITVSYPNILRLLRELKKMGQGNYLLRRSDKPITKEYLAYAEKIFGNTSVTFEVIIVFGNNDQKPCMSK